MYEAGRRYPVSEEIVDTYKLNSYEIRVSNYRESTLEKLSTRFKSWLLSQELVHYQRININVPKCLVSWAAFVLKSTKLDTGSKCT